ncbi:Hypothetical predicted protein [Mytilus galloprovincialis]|uniref:Uncharacterized protein n=1 Tax=Mytilus galloprovincialis TaxID=29158 RepID=A0A8B6GRH0_MYTGA|nr:Hypothetical predicted protein [Mytilus galloprovincialis]
MIGSKRLWSQLLSLAITYGLYAWQIHWQKGKAKKTKTIPPKSEKEPSDKRQGPINLEADDNLSIQDDFKNISRSIAKPVFPIMSLGSLPPISDRFKDKLKINGDKDDETNEEKTRKSKKKKRKRLLKENQVHASNDELKGNIVVNSEDIKTFESVNEQENQNSTKKKKKRKKTKVQENSKGIDHPTTTNEPPTPPTTITSIELTETQTATNMIKQSTTIETEKSSTINADEKTKIVANPTFETVNEKEHDSPKKRKKKKKKTKLQENIKRFNEQEYDDVTKDGINKEETKRKQKEKLKENKKITSDQTKDYNLVMI